MEVYNHPGVVDINFDVFVKTSDLSREEKENILNLSKKYFGSSF
jgi:hypothetical protein